LAEDLDEIGTDLVSLMIVPAPFDGYDRALLDRCFSRVVPFKSHYVADLNRPIEQNVKKSHRETVARAAKKVHVSLCPDPLARLEDWMHFFDTLTRRHCIRGIRAFSRRAFAAQLAVPGLVMFEARTEEESVGLDLWYRQGDVAYGHLVAFSELGYALRASYATKWHMLNHFAGLVRWVDFGGGAGAETSGTDGLSVFKQGWSSGSVPVAICGRVFDPATYDQLTRARGAEGAAYFPAYRAGELL
jgi:hypothetical protein